MKENKQKYKKWIAEMAEERKKEMTEEIKREKLCMLAQSFGQKA